jgi:hypothetical protein
MLRVTMLRVSRSSARARTAIALLLASLLPFQVLTGLYLDLRGPLHFHVEYSDHDHDHSHTHAHSHLERHHHAAIDAGVVTVHDGERAAFLALEETEAGWSSVMFATLAASAECVALLDTSSGYAPTPAPILRTHLPRGPERPPRDALL